MFEKKLFKKVVNITFSEKKKILAYHAKKKKLNWPFLNAHTKEEGRKEELHSTTQATAMPYIDFFQAFILLWAQELFAVGMNRRRMYRKILFFFLAEVTDVT